MSNYHPPQPYVRSHSATLQHVSPPYLHTHPHGHGHYHHQYHSSATLPSTHPSNDRDRRLRVRVRQRDVLLTALPSPSPTPAPASASASGPTTPLLARRRSHVEVGQHSPGAGTTEMDVDADTDDAADDMNDAEVETDCLTSRAPSRAASPPPLPLPHGWPPRRGAPYLPEHGYLAAEGSGGALAIQTPAHLDLAGTCFDPRGAWLYVASTTGIVEWGVRGGEKRWWSESAWV